MNNLAGAGGGVIAINRPVTALVVLEFSLLGWLVAASFSDLPDPSGLWQGYPLLLFCVFALVVFFFLRCPETQRTPAGGIPLPLFLLVRRISRHDTLNCLQVVSGWLQLGRLERAQTALAELESRLRQEAGYTSSLPSSLACFLILEPLLAKSQGAAVEIHVSGRPLEGDLTERQLEVLRWALRAVVRLILQHGQGALAVHVVTGENRLTLKLPLPGGGFHYQEWENLFQDQVGTKRRARDVLRARGVELTWTGQDEMEIILQVAL
ncbi:MAG: Spo0B domain-containing protein [Bacillota bacterium]